MGVREREGWVRSEGGSEGRSEGEGEMGWE